MIRNLATRLNRLFAERSHPVRVRRSVPIKITFEPLKSTAKLMAPGSPIYIAGETFDLSGSGIAFIVSSIRVMEHYLVGQDRALIAELDLPSGKIAMKVIGTRYERIGVHLSMEKYLVGAHIIDMTHEAREAYDDFLQQGNTAQVARAAALGLGID